MRRQEEYKREHDLPLGDEHQPDRKRVRESEVEPLAKNLPDPAPNDDSATSTPEEEKEENRDPEESIHPAPIIAMGQTNNYGMQGYIYPPAANEILPQGEEPASEETDEKKEEEERKGDL